MKQQTHKFPSILLGGFSVLVVPALIYASRNGLSLDRNGLENSLHVFIACVVGFTMGLWYFRRKA
ncbi:MAG: hypothetical protein AMXMBFR84_51140 [Candidatus Hydrogenedentota bacterium]